ncbi:PQQ-binding-like beta-propeller repeat protein [Chitinophagaceae bacterium 26-R-25]|nr:PQQ-binding-like beta-propeller repeat protein [Chitinophagaceae bacterium 26-R-25]
MFDPKPYSMKILAVVIGLLFMISCSRSSQVKPDQHIRNIDSFAVVVVDRQPTSGVIQWSVAKNIHNADTVKYKIELNGRFVDSNLLQLRDTIRSLSPDTTYYGRVYAYTKSGDTASAPFALEMAKGYIFLGGTDNSLYCYEIYSGKRIWKSETHVISGNAIDIPTVENNVLYVNDANSSIVAFDAKTGAKKWKNIFDVSPHVFANQSNPLYINGRLYTTMNNGIYALNASTGDTIWRYPTADNFANNPVMAGNILITSTPHSEGTMLAVRAETGAKLWEREYSTSVCINPVVYNNLVISYTSAGTLFAFKPETGEVAWSKQTVRGFGAPIIYKDLVILQTGGQVLALKAADGTNVWSYSYSSSSVSSPCVGNDMVYFSVPGKAVALKAATGELAWERLYGSPAEWSTPICVKSRVYFGHNVLWGYGTWVLSAATGEVVANIAGDVQQEGGNAIVYDDTTYYLPESGMVQ